MSEQPDPNAWRTETPGRTDWPRTAQPDAANKYFMVSADGHVQEPSDLWKTRMDAQYHDRLPGMTLDAKGDMHQKTEGFRPMRIRNIKFEGEDALRNQSGRDPDARVSDLAKDGVDAEILFPNKGLTIWATPDPEFSQLMCTAWNDWAWEEFGDYNDRLAPMACIAPGALDSAIAEIEQALSWLDGV